MEMGRSGNGGGKMVTFDDAVTGRRRNGGSLSSFLDMGRDADGVRAAPRLLPAHAMGSRRRTYADGELDVFSAERYFKGAMDRDGVGKVSVSVTTPAVAVPVQVQRLVETAAARPAAEAVVMAKPSSTRASTVSFTASSASSANSQTALFRGRRSSRDTRCGCVKVGVLMRKCSGKRSVRVEGCVAKEAPDTAEPAPTGIDWYRELRMHKAALGLSGDGNSHGLVAAGRPPSLNLGTAKVAAIGREVTGEEKEAADLTLSSSMRRRSNFTLVAPVRANVPASGRLGEPRGAGKGGGGAHHLHVVDDDDDAGSESSSDLFEIKSLMIGDGDCPYEPSEASIQWSVVTASAADASERGDRVPARWVGGSGSGARGPVAGRQIGGHRPAGILAGCASHRAVDVSAATTKAVPNVAMQQRRSEGFQKARNGA